MHAVERLGRGLTLAALVETRQQPEERLQGLNPPAAVRAFSRVTLQSPARTGTEIILQVMRQPPLRPRVAIAVRKQTAIAHRIELPRTGQKGEQPSSCRIDHGR